MIVQHIGVDFAPELAQWLGKRSAAQGPLASAGDRPVPGTALVAGTSDHLVMAPDRTLRYTPDPVDYPYRPSVDALYNSIAAHWPAPGVAVLLTGIGRDGRPVCWHCAKPAGIPSPGRGIERRLRHAQGGPRLWSGDSDPPPQRHRTPRQRADSSTFFEQIMKPATPAAAILTDLPQFAITVLLVDDQAIIGEAVRRMLQSGERHRLPLLRRSDQGPGNRQSRAAHRHPPGPGHAGDRRHDTGEVLPRQSWHA